MPSEPATDIKLSSVLPYWFFGLAVGVFGLLSWAARGVGFWIWLTVGVFAVFAAIILVLRSIPRNESRTADWYRNLQRLGCFGMVAGATGFCIRFVFALATVYVENENPFDVRLVMDGQEWLSIPAGGQLKKSLARGTHLIDVYSHDRDLKLDEGAIEVFGHGNYVLNVLGAQTYFRGEIIYGGVGKAPPMEVVQDKWFEFHNVDYLFKDPPELIELRHFAAREKKTYLTRGAPPVFKGKEKKD